MQKIIGNRTETPSEGTVNMLDYGGSPGKFSFIQHSPGKIEKSSHNNNNNIAATQNLFGQHNLHQRRNLSMKFALKENPTNTGTKVAESYRSENNNIDIKVVIADNAVESNQE